MCVEEEDEKKIINKNGNGKCWKLLAGLIGNGISVLNCFIVLWMFYCDESVLLGSERVSEWMSDWHVVEIMIFTCMTDRNTLM